MKQQSHTRKRVKQQTHLITHKDDGCVSVYVTITNALYTHALCVRLELNTVVVEGVYVRMGYVFD